MSTDMSWSVDQVELADSDTASLRIGGPPYGIAGLTAVPLNGMVLQVDPAHPDVPPTGAVTDPSSARETVRRLFGSEVANALEDGGIHHARLATSYELRDLQRLGTLWWLRECAPLALDPHLLHVETAIAQASLAEFLDHDEDWTAALVDLAPSIVAAAAQLRTEPAIAADLPGAVSLVDQAMSLLDRLLPTDHPARTDLEHETELTDAAVHWGLRQFDAATALDLMRPLRPKSAHAAGAEEQDLSGSATVDWARVRPGILSPDEDAVSWQIDVGGMLSVVVPTAATPRIHPLFAGCNPGPSQSLRQGDEHHPVRLRFALYRTRWPIPLCEGELELQREAGAWIGVTRLDSALRRELMAWQPSALTVEIRESGTRQPPRLGASGQAAEAGRWAVRGLCGLRLSGVGSAGAAELLRTAAADAFFRGRALWSDLGARHRPDSGSQPSYAREAEFCGHILRTLDETSTNTSAPSAIRISDPGFAPTATEIWLCTSDPEGS